MSEFIEDSHFVHSGSPKVIGRAAAARGPANRFEKVRVEADLEQLAVPTSDDEFTAVLDPELSPEPRKIPTQFFIDRTQSIIAENDSPDIVFRYSVNPYRGCEHGCVYCFARPGHEYLGWNAGIDFESRILVKHDAPQLFRRALNDPKWEPQLIALSGVTDCYQPAERHFKLTRGILEVALEARQPMGIVTKNVLVTRDLDILKPMAERRLVHVLVSLTTLNAELARTMEPRTASPQARLRAIRELSAAGVPVMAMTAPIIPGLTDEEIPRLLEAAAEAGAITAAMQLVRLPLAVEPIFREWLARNFPSAVSRVEKRILEMRGGKFNEGRFGKRMRPEGTYAAQVKQTFQVFRKKYGLDGRLPPFDCSQFRPPKLPGGQGMLF